MFAPGQSTKALFWKTAVSPSSRALQRLPSDSLFFPFPSVSLCLPFPSEIVWVPPAVVISLFPVTCLLWAGGLGDLALGSEWQRQSMRSWRGENTGVCNLISFSSVFVFPLLSFSLSGTWVSVTVGRCWLTEEPRSPCWWWKVTYNVQPFYFPPNVERIFSHLPIKVNEALYFITSSSQNVWVTSDL